MPASGRTQGDAPTLFPIIFLRKDAKPSMMQGDASTPFQEGDSSLACEDISQFQLSYVLHNMRDNNLALLFDEVRTERLMLRRLRIEDGPAMFAVHGDLATNLYNPSDPDLDLVTSEETLREWLQGWESEGYGYWAITLQQSEDVLSK